MTLTENRLDLEEMKFWTTYEELPDLERSEDEFGVQWRFCGENSVGGELPTSGTGLPFHSPAESKGYF